MSDATLQRAFVRSLEVMGEAAKRLLPDLTACFPNVPWRDLARMRDRLIHGYFGVDYEVVWDVAANRAPWLVEALERILGAIED